MPGATTATACDHSHPRPGVAVAPKFPQLAPPISTISVATWLIWVLEGLSPDVISG